MSPVIELNFLTWVGVFFSGVAVSFTPCVFPLIPVVIAVIGSARDTAWRRRLALSLSYALGLALTYAFLGLAAGLTGRIFGRLQSHYLTSLLVGVFFIIFGLAMLGVIRLPLGWLNRAGIGKRIQGRGAGPVFLMGIASSFIAAPCTAPITGALLTFVAHTQRVVPGFLLLFCFAAGMSVLLVLAGTVTGFSSGMKRFNRWTPVVQKVMSFGIIAAGGFFIWRGLNYAGLFT